MSAPVLSRDPVVVTTPTTPTTPKATEARVRLRWSPAIATVLASGLFLLGFAGYLTVGSSIRHERDQSTLYKTLRGDLRHATVPVHQPIAPGAPVALVQVPKLGLTEVVVEGTSASELAAGPGHRRDTPLPGQPGVAVIAAHRTTYGGPFRHVDTLRTGDPIDVTTGQGTFRFTVDAVHRDGTPQQTLAPSTARLLLVTRGVEVAATLLRYPVAGIGAAPAIDDAEVPGHHDDAALLGLLLWSQLLLAVGVGAAVAWVRVPHAVIWLLATPVALLALLHVYADAAASVLPNTM